MGARGARQRILDGAAILFETGGISATTMEQVAARAPVSKRTLYAYFPTKEELVLAHLRHLHDAGLTIEAVLDRADLDPRDRILALFDPLAGRPVRGCPFAAAAAEFPDPRSAAHAHVRVRKRRFRAKLAKLLSEMGADDPSVFAEQIAIIADGTLMRAAVFNDVKRCTYGRAAAEALLDAALPARPATEVRGAPANRRRAGR